MASCLSLKSSECKVGVKGDVETEDTSWTREKGGCRDKASSFKFRTLYRERLCRPQGG